MDELKLDIKVFLERFTLGNDLREDDDIFALGLVNSMFALQLVLFVEQRFGLVIENEDLEIDNFRSVKSIAQLVARKRHITT